MGTPFVDFLAELQGDAPTVEALAGAFQRHLATHRVGVLPASAQQHWREVARLLKCPADAPVPEKAVAAIHSWPAARIAELVGHVRALNAILETLENERLEDEIRDSIRRHYL